MIIYDINSYLKCKTNVIEMYLGNGWHKGKFGYLDKGKLIIILIKYELSKYSRTGGNDEKNKNRLCTNKEEHF